MYSVFFKLIFCVFLNNNYLSVQIVSKTKLSVEAIYLLIFMGAVVAVGFLVAFLISVKNGQFEDNTTPSIRILFDDGTLKISKKKDKDSISKK